MRRATIFAALTVVLLFGSGAQAGVSLVMNGSFENDGHEMPDITVEEPNGWDVNVSDPNKLGGYVRREWVTDGSFNLTLYSEWYKEFDVNDMAAISQEVYLADVNEISFDLKPEAYLSSWDPAKCTALLLIDNVEVWNSDECMPDANGEYRNQVVPVDVADRNLHKLSLAMRVDVSETLSDFYLTQWDFVRFNVHCGGFGFLLADLNRDCYVDWNDLEILTDLWLSQIAWEGDPNAIYNWYRDDETEPYGFVNFLDFAVFAETWDGNVPDLGMLTGRWLDEVDVGYEYNLYQGDDVYPPGTVNFHEFAIFAESWMDSSYEQGN